MWINHRRAGGDYLISMAGAIVVALGGEERSREGGWEANASIRALFKWNTLDAALTPPREWDEAAGDRSPQPGGSWGGDPSIAQQALFHMATVNVTSREWNVSFSLPDLWLCDFIPFSFLLGAEPSGGAMQTTLYWLEINHTSFTRGPSSMAFNDWCHSSNYISAAWWSRAIYCLMIVNATPESHLVWLVSQERGRLTSIMYEYSDRIKSISSLHSTWVYISVSDQCFWWGGGVARS